MNARTLASATAITLATAAPAHAGFAQHAVDLAAAYWDKSPECTVSWRLDTLPDRFDAFASDCQITLNAASWPPLAREWPVYACTIIAHEYGHLLGYGHSADRSSVMHTPISTVTKPCAGAYCPQEIRRHGAPWRLGDTLADPFCGRWKLTRHGFKVIRRQ